MQSFFIAINRSFWSYVAPNLAILSTGAHFADPHESCSY